MQKNDLLKLNLEDFEVDIYWALLIEGKQSVYKLAKDLQIPRSTMYGYVSTLIAKGYLVWSNTKKSVKCVEAVRPENVKRVFELEKRKIDEYENVLTDLNTFVLDLNKQPLQLNIRYYEGVEGLEQIVWNTLSCKSGNMYGFCDWDRNHYLPNSFIELHKKEVWIRGPKDHIIAKKERIHDVADLKKDYPIEVRGLSTHKFYINGDTYIYDNIFAATMIKDGKINGFEIENEEFAKLQLSTFMLLWDIAEEIEE